MQSAGWYFRRLKAMSPAEILWRIRGRVRDATDACCWSWRVRQTRADRVLPAGIPAPIGDLRVLGEVLSLPGGAAAGDDADTAAVLSRADAAERHRFSFLGLTDIHLGEVIRWNFEPLARLDIPLNFAPRIDYRDRRVTGDCKLVWEPNRHQHLVALGQAYHLTGDARYAREVLTQIESWIDQCPFGYGMNWRSPLELAIRLINWVWALGLIARSGLPSGDTTKRILECAYRHLWEIRRKYSRFSSANNHLIGEAAGVYVGAAFFNILPGSSAARREARDILIREANVQTFPDGGNREQAFSYHLFVLEFFLICGVVGRRIGEDFPPEYWACVVRMGDFAAAWMEAGDPPMYGDADDGYVLGVGSLEQVGPSLIEALSRERPEFRVPFQPKDAPGHAKWLVGAKARSGGISGAAHKPHILRSRGFPDTGLYLLQGLIPETNEAVSVTLDAGPLGFGSLAAHGHADALAITLRRAGVTMLCDCGTYDYFTWPELRQFFRSTAAHNTVEVDGADSSVPMGPFLWGARAAARCLEWQPTTDGGHVIAEHDGYTRLPDPLIHRRQVALSLKKRELFIIDELTCNGSHAVRQFWHLGRGCKIHRLADNAFQVTGRGGTLLIRLDVALEVTLHCGKTDPPMGWYSPGYHCREPIVALIGTAGIAHTTVFTTHILLETGARAVSG